jgi:hypothetical protein
MRNRFHEPRSDPPSPRRLDDVNANKSLYGNKRETPSIRCHEPSRPTPGDDPHRSRSDSGAGSRSARPRRVQERADWSGSREMGTAITRIPGWLTRRKRSEVLVGTTGRAALRVSRQTACDLGIVPDSRGRASRADPGLAGHVRLAGNLEHRNPSASDIHPRNRTPVGNVSLATDDAIQGHRTGPGAIPRNKEGKDGC